jgi:hypothetical protein
MLLAVRPESGELRLAFPARMAVLTAAVAVSAFAVVGFLGNYPLARTKDRYSEGRFAAAAVEAHRAIRWQPWAGEPWKHLGFAERERGDRAAARRAWRKATERDPGDWVAWIELGTVTRGDEQLHAWAQTARLNPRSFRVANLCRRGYIPRPLCRKATESSAG